MTDIGYIAEAAGTVHLTGLKDTEIVRLSAGALVEKGLVIDLDDHLNLYASLVRK